MQLYTISRGKKESIDRWITEMSSKYLPYTHRGEKKLLQLLVRPIQLWEFAFPKQHRDTVLNTIFTGDQTFGKQCYPKEKMKAVEFAFRKMLRAKKIQPYKTDSQMPVCPRPGTSMIGIGERDDKDAEWGEQV